MKTFIVKDTTGFLRGAIEAADREAAVQAYGLKFKPPPAMAVNHSDGSVSYLSQTGIALARVRFVEAQEGGAR